MPKPVDRVLPPGVLDEREYSTELDDEYTVYKMITPYADLVDPFFLPDMINLEDLECQCPEIQNRSRQEPSATPKEAGNGRHKRNLRHFFAIEA